MKQCDITKALFDYDKKVHPAGETLPDEQRVFCVEVIEACMKAGIPINKLKHFHSVLEKHSFKLADDRGMRDLIPFVFERETKLIKSKLEGRNISVIFDGTTRLGEVLAIVVRFVADWKIEQRPIRLQL